jgi:hypothetical protein
MQAFVDFYQLSLPFEFEDCALSLKMKASLFHLQANSGPNTNGCQVLSFSWLLDVLKV